MLDPEDPVVRWATFGKLVEDFLSGPIGAHLVSKAQGEIDEAVEKLKHVDPEDAKSIRALQNRAHVAESIVGWLGDVIHEGLGALAALKEDEHAR
jgi:hypothetical protein